MISLIVESYIWFALVVVIAIFRFISRSLALGSVRKLQADDFVMLGALCTYTTVIVTINIVADASTNLLPPGFDMSSLTPQDRADREYGSKLVLVVEQCQVITVWAAKACILIMYSRLTVGRVENIAIKALAGYVVFGFVFMEIFYFGVWCRPFHYYWAVPTPNMQCNTAIHHLITNAVFNLSSDTILLAIALPMFIRSKLPIRKKAPLIGVFGLGIFVILCAILNKYYSFTQPFGSLWTFWYVRESSTALLVTNLPFMWTLFRRVFKFKFLETTVLNNEYDSTPMSRRRRGSDSQFDQEFDPESGRQFSDCRNPSINKKDIDTSLLSTPSSFGNSWNDSWASRSTSSPLITPARCVVRDDIVEPSQSSSTSESCTFEQFLAMSNKP